MSGLEIEGLIVALGGNEVLKETSLSVPPGELACILGPSGCGKTTTLNVVAGFVVPDSGSVVIGGRDVTALPPFSRDIGMVFQNYALFPHMTVRENIAYGLKTRKRARQDIEKRVESVVRMLALDGLEKRYPGELSGGQQQRVAVARGVVVEPSILLLDEPLSNLDAKLREDIRLEFRRLQQRLGVTTLFVTHDQKEAFVLADRVMVMSDGRVVQAAPPEELFRRPVNRYVAEFVGVKNILSGQMTDGVFVADGGLKIPCKEGRPGVTHVGIRDSDLRIEESTGSGSTDETARFEVEVVERFFEGEVTRCTVRLTDRPDTQLALQVSNSGGGTEVAVGSRLELAVDASCVIPLSD